MSNTSATYKDYYETEYGCSHIETDSLTYRKQNPYKGQTRNNKIRLGVAFREIKSTAKQYIEYCKRIPEEENKEHAERVEKLTCAMEALCKEMHECIDKAIYGE